MRRGRRTRPRTPEPSSYSERLVPALGMVSVLSNPGVGRSARPDRKTWVMSSARQIAPENPPTGVANSRSDSPHLLGLSPRRTNSIIGMIVATYWPMLRGRRVDGISSDFSVRGRRSRHILAQLPKYVAAAIGLAGCSGSDADPTSGSGGTAAELEYRDGPDLIDEATNSCPPDLIHAGSAPGIACETPGDTCADDAHFCECGESTFEGAPWRCVPTGAECPAALPHDGEECTIEEACDYVDDSARMRCACEASQWACRDITETCPVAGVLSGQTCDVTETQMCSRFRPTTLQTLAADIPCQCIGGTWECADGCPREFPGDGNSCDTSSPSNCSWTTPEGWTSCGCNGQWNCTVRD